MKRQNERYVEKNHMNCAWLDGIPNSVVKRPRSEIKTGSFQTVI